MTFSDIIQKNYEMASMPVKWWTKYAFHYTDILNAISILQTGTLYSRFYAQKAHLMKNDNASFQVIDTTSAETQSYVRFYFRPLTPTQYYNEGYKHPDLRYDKDKNANVPVPIFFAFNLEKFLENPNVEFSALSQAGYGSSKLKGVSKFSELPFKDIYSFGYVDDNVRKYRHAELLYPDSYNIDDSLEVILCRNEFEQTMLLSLLQKNNKKIFDNYKNIVRVCRNNMFEKNGLFINDINFLNNHIVIRFSDTYEKTRYDNIQMQKYGFVELKTLKLNFLLEWNNSFRLLKILNFEIDFDYLKQPNILIEIPYVDKSKELHITIKCNDELIGYKKFILSEML